MQRDNDTLERFLLATDRIREIPDELKDADTYKKNKLYSGTYDYLGFFNSKAEYINLMMDIYFSIYPESFNYENNEESVGLHKVEEPFSPEINRKMFEDILGEKYMSSYSNPDFAEAELGAMGSTFSFVSAELMNLPGYIFDDKLHQVLYLLEMFLQLYFLFASGDEVTISSVEEVIYYYALDYIDFFTEDRMMDTFIPENGVAYDIVTKSDLNDISYLYKYGEYISDTEIKLAEFLNKLSDDRIEDVAHTFTDGFRRGFDVMGVDFTGKRSVWIRYHIGQERIVRAAIKQFDEMGLKTILSRCAGNRSVRRGVVRQGYESTPANQQFEYDHRNDNVHFITSDFVERRTSAARKTYEKLAEYNLGDEDINLVSAFAGPAVIETFGEDLFSPIPKESVPSLDDGQEKLSRSLYGKLGEISNEFLPGDSYSFTIIAFPIPDIGDDFESIFEDVVSINTLDNDKYIRIQQSIIDVLDVADKVRIIGMNGNRTDMTVQMRRLENPDKETQFENCTADVNIPLGEVFTSPVLKGTEGILNVSSVYLNGYNFEDIELRFKDGVVSDYSCSNFDDIEKGRRYIKENILFNHEFLPLGEFAIGTNTLAYTMGRKYNILSKLPILIVEKTGPHFAVGDTCYSHAEDHAVFNPDGKEIISRENDFSMLRDTEPDKAYFNCHTDITIPYNELGRLYTLSENGEETDIIVEGRFVLPGTEELNDALE